jgi:hypothetical protein
MHRVLALALVALLAAVNAGRAQTPPPTPPPTPAAPTPALPSPAATAPRPGAAATRTGDCALLPGGKAPVQQIADLAAPLAPRSLDMVYFGKRLSDLTHEDFQRIAELSQRCGPGEGILSDDKLAKLEAILRDAQKVRGQSIAWGKQRMAEVEALPPGRDRLIRLNQLWSELDAHESELTREDVDAFAAWIAREQQAIYDASSPARPRPQTAGAAPAAPSPTGLTPMGRAPSAAGSSPPAAVPAPAPAVPAKSRPRRQGGEED